MHRFLRAPFAFPVPALALALALGGCSSSPTTGSAAAPSNGNGAASGDDAGGSAEPSGGNAGSNSSPTGGDDDAQAPSDPTQEGDGGATMFDGGAVLDGEAGSPSDASTLGDGQSAAPDGGGDAGPLVNGCTEAEYVLHDESGANGVRTIAFAKAAPATQYDPNCMRIAKGQTVTWNGDLKLFPLDPMGGTTPTPIKATKKGTTVTFTFDAAGTYGFDSSAQPKVMFGAIDVLP